ncbi:MAG: type II secretion system protein [Planctomycetota bacterium]|jgi:type II secretory pathway pseudopilin PulG
MARIRGRRGFTLVELTVVIGVVVFLIGLTLTLGSAVVEQANTRETETTLRLLDQAMETWELAADRQLTWWDVHDNVASKQHHDVHGDTPEVLIITQMLSVIARHAEAREILERIQPEFMYTYGAGEYPAWIRTPDQQQHMNAYEGQLTVLDAWGVPIYATHPGRSWSAAVDTQNGRDDDGTIRTYNERNYGVTRNRRVCFVSAGPDRRFGLMHLPDSEAGFAFTRDNVFSYEVDRP